ncbi:MAG: thioredoxin domain-containing protein [Pseudomonadota bacterium]
MKHIRFSQTLLALGLWCAVAIAALSAPAAAASSAVTAVTSTAAFDAAITGGDRLVLVEFTADWCAPCRKVAPIISAIAAENPNIRVYVVDVDNNGELAAREGIRGIPYVAFYRKGQKVYDLVGLHAEYRYHQAIRQLDAAASDAADGDIVNGVRVIRRPAAATIDSIYVYRGETVLLSMAPADTAYAIHIPGLSVSAENTAAKPLDIRFKAKSVGVYPIYCNGACPTGDGMQTGRIVVMPYAEAAETADTSYTEVSAAEARQLISAENPFILDVRTPMEFKSGYIPGAVLIPVQQLADRIGEIASQRDRKILIYCRSGNRSTVAAEILHRAGFRAVWNLRHGILEWQAAGYPVTTPG